MDALSGARTRQIMYVCMYEEKRTAGTIIHQAARAVPCSILGENLGLARGATWHG